MTRKIKRAFVDIETSPNKHLAWRAGYKINLSTESILEERQIICASWKWEHEKKPKSVTWEPVAIPKKFKIGKRTYKGYDLAFNDLPILEKIIPVLDEADEIVYQNGDRFDLPWIKTRALYHRVLMQPSYRTFDTLKKAKSNFYFNSNRLDYVKKFLGKKGKMDTDFDLWKRVCLENDQKALKYMVKYCEQDVLELEEYFNIIKTYVPHNIHVGSIMDRDKYTCAGCGSHQVSLSKTRYTAMGTIRRQMQCSQCGTYYTISNSSYKEFTKVRQQERSLNG
jgi:DNA polymerase elongation subunit (family B)